MKGPSVLPDRVTKFILKLLNFCLEHYEIWILPNVLILFSLYIGNSGCWSFISSQLPEFTIPSQNTNYEGMI
jgi:hypothetical protein